MASACARCSRSSSRVCDRARTFLRERRPRACARKTAHGQREQAALVKAPATLEIPSLIISARTIVQQDHGDVKLILFLFFFFSFFLYLDKGLLVRCLGGVRAFSAPFAIVCRFRHSQEWRLHDGLVMRTRPRCL